MKCSINKKLILKIEQYYYWNLPKLDFKPFYKLSNIVSFKLNNFIGFEALYPPT